MAQLALAPPPGRRARGTAVDNVVSGEQLVNENQVVKWT